MTVITPALLDPFFEGFEAGDLDRLHMGTVNADGGPILVGIEACVAVVAGIG